RVCLAARSNRLCPPRPFRGCPVLVTAASNSQCHRQIRLRCLDGSLRSPCRWSTRATSSATVHQIRLGIARRLLLRRDTKDLLIELNRSGHVAHVERKMRSHGVLLSNGWESTV